MIEAMITSVDEPQLDRCLESVNYQTVPFSNVVHINGVVPIANAFNQGVEKVTDEWFMFIGGDFILYPNAVEITMKYVNRDFHEEICGYCFGIRDTFLECNTGFCSVYRTSAYKPEIFQDTMSDDRDMPWRLRSKGWRFRKPRDIIATHFDNPSEFQVFSRFYFHANKFNDDNSYVRIRMNELLVNTGNPLYQIGINALDFAKLRHIYQGSPNLDFNKKMYKEFKEYYENFHRYSSPQQSQGSIKADQAFQKNAVA